MVKGAFAKQLRQVPISLVMSVYLGYQWEDFREILYLGFLRK